MALTHPAHGFDGVANISESIDEELATSDPVRTGTFDGENADPANIRVMDNAVLAYLQPYPELPARHGLRSRRLPGQSPPPDGQANTAGSRWTR